MLSNTYDTRFRCPGLKEPVKINDFQVLVKASNIYTEKVSNTYGLSYCTLSKADLIPTCEYLLVCL